jgi:hypothetical protein
VIVDDLELPNVACQHIVTGQINIVGSASRKGLTHRSTLRQPNRAAAASPPHPHCTVLQPFRSWWQNLEYRQVQLHCPLLGSTGRTQSLHTQLPDLCHCDPCTSTGALMHPVLPPRRHAAPHVRWVRGISPCRCIT